MWQCLTVRERAVWSKAFPLLRAGRSWEYRHAVVCMSFSREILDQGTIPETYAPVIMPTVMLHDIGWALMSRDAKTAYSDDDSRVAHMTLGSKKAEELLLGAGYSTDEIVHAIAAVAEHDNKYLGRPFQHDLTRYVFEVDSLWRLTSDNLITKNIGKGPQYMREKYRSTALWLEQTGAIVTDAGACIARRLSSGIERRLDIPVVVL